MLYARHPSVAKRFPWQTAGLALIALACRGPARPVDGSCCRSGPWC
ncbi:MAG: hypothetical protein MZV70_05380 [Desulfobacterales bacterium]|nr:hypothetical protein [Desulfobacterales bacterium]